MIMEGKVKSRTMDSGMTGKQSDRKIQICRASGQRLSEAAEIVETVDRLMDHREWFVAESLEEFERWMKQGKGILYLAVDADSGEAGGMFFAVIPGMDPENLGYDIGMEETELEQVALMDTAAVLPGFRGYNLQYRMMQAAEQDLQKMGYRYLMCTVHPENRFSRENVKRQGYRKVMTKEKYGGYLRDIWLKELK